jgi:hypothetical protein
MLTEKEIETIIADEQVGTDSDDVMSLQPKDSLSAVLWEDDNLKDDLRNILYRIALEYYLTLNVRAPVKDVIITGSLANYNYTDHSDVDLHILIDYRQVDEDFDLVQDYMNAKKSIWNDKHDIKIKGHDVELYSQDVNEPHHSTGTYSIMKDSWVDTPKPQSANIDFGAVRQKALGLMKQIDDVLSEESPSPKRIDALKVKIRKMRQSGLETSGEYSVENLAFKVLRNTEYIKRLYDRAVEEFDKSLSIENEELSENRIAYSSVLNRLLGASKKWKNMK